MPIPTCKKISLALDISWLRHLSFGLLLLACPALLAAEPVAIRWRIGAEFSKVLESTGGGTWSRFPLHKAIENLAQVHRVCLILDRRVDPEQLLEYTSEQQSLEVTLRGMATRLKLDVAIGDSWVYFGPAATANKLRTLIHLRQQELTDLGLVVSKNWRGMTTLNLQQPTGTRDYIKQLLTSTKTELANPEVLVHDLWDGKSWPTLPTSECLTLVLAQFDLTWQLNSDGTSLKLIPVPDQVSYRQEYRWRTPSELQSKLQKLGITSKVELSEQSLALTGTWEEHRLVRDLLSGKTVKTTTVVEGSQRYTLKSVLPIGKFIQALAQKLNLKLELSTAAIMAANISLEQEVRVEVNQVTRDELLRAVLGPAGLTYEIQDDRLLVKPKE